MISISKKDLSQYQKIGFGKYGTVYQINDNTAYKIYHPYTVDKEGFKTLNPALQVSKKRLENIMKRNKKIKYSDLITDYIIIDGHFGGVCIPYYEGHTLDDLLTTSYKIKREISKQLVRNHKELKRNLIYPLDYHLGNVMFSNNKVKIIDLYDPLTKVEIIPNLLASLISTSRLNETIQTLFQEEQLTYHNKQLLKLLGRKKVKFSTKEDWLTNYLANKEQIQDYLLIDEFTKIETIKSLMRDKQYRIILIIDELMHTNEYLINKLLSLRQNNIFIYDIIHPQDIESYFSNFPTTEKILIKENRSTLLTN